MSEYRNYVECPLKGKKGIVLGELIPRCEKVGCTYFKAVKESSESVEMPSGCTLWIAALCGFKEVAEIQKKLKEIENG